MYYKVQEIAEKYQVTYHTVRRWIKQHNIPTELEYRVGHKPYIVLKLEDVEKAIKVKEYRKWHKKESR